MKLRRIVVLICVTLLAGNSLRCDAVKTGTWGGGFRRPAFWLLNRQATDSEIEARADALARIGVDAVILGGGEHHYLHNDLPNLDQYVETARRIVDACHARGIKVAEHHSAVLLGDKEYAQKHRDWLQYDFTTGEPSVWPEYQTYSFCPNNPEFREHYWKIAKEIVQRTGVDALMSDDTVFHHGCCCPSCSKRWQEEVGGDIREAYEKSRGPGTPDWRRFNEVRRRWYADFRAWLRDRQAAELPGTACISLIGCILCAWGTQTHGGSIEGGLDTADIAIWEVYNPADFYSWRRLAAESAALYEAARVRNVLPVCFPYADTAQKPDQYDPEEEVFMWALAQAHGMPFGLGRVFLNGPTENDPPRDYYVFERDRLESYLGSKPAAAVGIMFSRHSRDNDPALESTHSAPAIAWAEALLDRCIPWQAVTEETIDNGLPKHLRTLILPNVFALSDRHLDSLEKFVKDGGVLIASYLPAVCDETGELVLDNRRDRLAGLLGVQIRSAELGEAASGQPRADFEVLGAARFHTELEVYMNSFGKGRVYYLPSLIERAAFLDWINEGATYRDNRDKCLVEQLAAMVLELTPEQPVRIERQDSNLRLLTTVRRLGRRLLVFIVNAAGADLSAGRVVPTPSRVVWGPQTELSLSFPKAPKSVRLVSLDSNEDRTISRPGCRVVVRSPRRFAMVVADL